MICYIHKICIKELASRQRFWHHRKLFIFFRNFKILKMQMKCSILKLTLSSDIGSHLLNKVRNKSRVHNFSPPFPHPFPRRLCNQSS